MRPEAFSLRCRSGIVATLLVLSTFAAFAEEPESENPETDVSELTLEDLFRPSPIRFPRVSPDGKSAAYFRDDQLVVGDAVAGFANVRKFSKYLNIIGLDWIDTDTIWITIAESDRARAGNYVIRVARNEDGQYSMAREIMHYEPGFIYKELPGDRDHIVFAKIDVEDDYIATELYRVNVFEPMQDQVKRRNRIDTGSDEFFYYLQDASGAYVLGVRFAKGVPEIWRRTPGGDWEHLWTAVEESDFEPWQLSADGRTLWVLSNVTTDRLAAVEFNLETREFGDVLYEHDRFDLESILMSRNPLEPIGVTYTEQGLLRYHYFSDDKKSEFDALQSRFPDKGILVIDYSEDRNSRLVVASSTSERGVIHFCDIAQDTCSRVESIAPWLDERDLYKTFAMDIPSSDGIVVEAFLTMPDESGGRVPLVAMPHGGPIGVSDKRYFSPDVQWLAHNGFAVLQVNYRGSSGYGQEFRAAGLRQWGRGIEDDIEASVRAVLEAYPQIDGDRVGIFGGSYGGYSALMSAIRNPDMFKCAASWGGVTDLTLLFTQTGYVRSEELRKTLVRYVGSPEMDASEQIENSPVYRYRELHRPVFLGHGDMDPIVDIEHSLRLQKMLSLSSNEPEFVSIPNVGHSFEYIAQARAFFDPLIVFLNKHLKGPSGASEPEEAVQ